MQESSLSLKIKVEWNILYKFLSSLCIYISGFLYENSTDKYCKHAAYEYHDSRDNIYMLRENVCAFRINIHCKISIFQTSRFSFFLFENAKMLVKIYNIKKCIFTFLK